MISLFFSFELFFEGIALSSSSAIRTDVFHTHPAKSAEVVRTGFRTNMDNEIAMPTGEGVALCDDALWTCTGKIPTSTQHYCSSNRRVPTAVDV